MPLAESEASLSLVDQSNGVLPGPLLPNASKIKFRYTILLNILHE